MLVGVFLLMNIVGGLIVILGLFLVCSTGNFSSGRFLRGARQPWAKRSAYR
jgi:hypothetical protein